MSLPIISFARVSKSNFLLYMRLLASLSVCFFAFNYGFAINQNGQMTDSYIVDWNGSNYLISGNGLSDESFPTLNFYDNNYYIFRNISSGGVRFSLGEDNSTEYNGNEIWNNGAYGNDEYLLFSPDSNSSRTFYYFNPENNSSVGQINISEHESSSIQPQVNVATSKFGQSVKVNDWNQTIVGSPGNRASYDGAVHVFNMDSNGTYSYFQKIDPPISGKVGQFGYALSTDGNNLLIGAPDDDNFTGFVYAYIREANGSYNLAQTINSYSIIGDSFGWDLSASNQYLAVSSRQTNNNGSGKVSILENNGSAWNLVSTLFADDNQSDDEFGYSIELSGTRLISGAPKADANGTDSGAAYIFERNQSGWFQTAKLSPSGLSADDQFGYSVALEGDLAFVGARQKDGNATNAGAIYVFRLDGTNWTEIRQIYPPQDIPDQYYASDVRVNGDVLAVTSPFAGEGFTYIYRVENNGSDISLISSLNLSEANSTDQSQLGLAVGEGFVLVGISGDSANVDTGGSTMSFHNDAWQAKSLPAIEPIIDRNSSVLFPIDEDSGTFSYDFNGSFPYPLELGWTLSKFPASGAVFDINSSTGAFGYTPDGNFSGNQEFTARFSQGNLYDSIDFNVSINPIADPPVFSAQSIENAMVGDDYNQSIALFDAENDPLILSLSSGSLPPGLAINVNNIVGVPSENAANGAPYYDYNFTLSVTDNLTPLVSQSFTLRVLKRNNPPLIWVDGNSSMSNLFLSVNEDINSTSWIQSIPVLDFNDSDGHLMELNASVLPSHGTLTLDLNASDSNQTVLYIPDGNYTGSDSFTIWLRDTEGEGNKSSKLIFNITINPVNDPPHFINETRNLTASEGVFFEHNFSFYDPDENDTHSLTFINLPTWLNYDNNFTISGTPAWSDYSEGSSGNVYVTLADQNGLTDGHLFTLQVIPLNYPPVISPGGSLSISLDEDGFPNGWNRPSLSVTDADTSLSNLQWQVDVNASHGSVTLSGTVDNPQIDYLPDANYSGIDSFILSVIDNNDINASDSITFNLTINPIEDPPIFDSNITYLTAVVGYEWNYNFSYLDSDSMNGLEVNATQLPGWLNFYNTSSSTGYVRGTPTSTDEGNHSVNLQVVDPSNLSANQNFVVQVVSQNTPPSFTQGSSLSVNVNEDVALDLKPLVSVQDPDSQRIILSESTAPLNGTLIIGYEMDLLSTFNYVPDANYSGADSFVLQVSDGIDSDNITVSVTVNPVNDPPVFVGFPSQIQIIDHQGLDLNITFMDADSFAGVTASVLVNSSNGQSSWLSTDTGAMESGIINLNGSPSENDDGNYSITLTVWDATDLNASQNFLLEVLVLNTAPVINEGNVTVSVSMVEDGEWIPPFIGASDQESNASNLSWSIFSAPQNGVASIDLSGANFTYAPDGNFSGLDSFVVKVQDNGVPGSAVSKSDSITVQVSVLAENDAPAFTSTPVTRWNDESDYLYKVTTFDSDSGGVNANLELNSLLPEWLIFTNDGNGSGSLFGSPTKFDIGQYNIEFKATDVNGTTTLQSFSLLIKVDNYQPEIKTVFGNLLSQTRIYAYEDTVNDFSGIISFSASDRETPSSSLSWNLVSVPVSGGSVQIEGNGSIPSVFSYSPPLNFSGEDSFSISVSDGERNASLLISVSVIPIVDRPQLVSFPSEITVMEGEDFNVSINSSDVDMSERFLVLNGIQGGDDWLREVQINNTAGSVVLGGIPPYGTANSERIITVQVIDSTALTSDFISQLKIKIIPHDLVQNNSIGTVAINEDQNNSILELNNSFVDNSLISINPIVYEANSSNPELVQVGIVGSKLYFYPQPNLSGNCSIQLKVQSGTRLLYSSFLLTVLPVDDPPFQSQTFPNPSIFEDGNYSSVSLGAYFSDIDTNSELFSYSLGSFSNDIFTAEIIDQKLKVYPKANQYGTSPVSVIVESSGLLATADWNITILEVNDPPQITSKPLKIQTISEDSSPISWVPLILNAVDMEGDQLSWEMLVKPVHGNYSFLSGRMGNSVEINYSPYSNYFGEDSMIVKVTDGNSTDQLEVKINIESVDDGPFMIKEIPMISMMEDGFSQRISLSNYFSDLDSEDNLIQFSVTGAASNSANLTIEGTDLIVYPTLNQNGNSFAQLDVNSSGLIYSTYINISVTAVDDAPFLVQKIPDQIIISGNSRVINLATFFDDIDSADSSFSFSASTDNERLTGLSIINSNLNIRTENNQTGEVLISVQASNSGLSVQTQFKVTVQSEKDINYSEENLSKFLSNSLGTSVEKWKLNWFGYFTVMESKWIYHSEIGWIFPRPSTDLNQMWFWMDSMGWLWTSSQYWGQGTAQFLFSVEKNTWLYFQKDSLNRSMLYNYKDNTWSVLQ